METGYYLWGFVIFVMVAIVAALVFFSPRKYHYNGLVKNNQTSVDGNYGSIKITLNMDENRIRISLCFHGATNSIVLDTKQVSFWIYTLSNLRGSICKVTLPGSACDCEITVENYGRVGVRIFYANNLNYIALTRGQLKDLIIALKAASKLI